MNKYKELYDRTLLNQQAVLKRIDRFRQESFWFAVAFTTLASVLLTAAVNIETLAPVRAVIAVAVALMFLGGTGLVIVGKRIEVLETKNQNPFVQQARHATDTEFYIREIGSDPPAGSTIKKCREYGMIGEIYYNKLVLERKENQQNWLLLTAWSGLILAFAGMLLVWFM